MSLINFFAIGGSGEAGKNMYALEVDKELFLFDSGMKYPSSEFYGVDIVLPDITFIINNSTRIKGLFLSHAHDDHIGALPHILKYVKLDIYATKFTLEVVKVLLQENEIEYDYNYLHEVSYLEPINFYPNKITFISASHGIPGAAIICLQTKDGNIVYTGNYNLDQNNINLYHTDLDALCKIGENNVLMLLHESISNLQMINRDLNQTFMFNLNKEISKAPGRIIITLYSTNLQRIEQVIKVALENKKKIAIIGKKTQRIINIAIKQKYLNLDDDAFVNLKYISEYNQNNQKDLVCIVCGERHEPYYMLQRMCKNVDRLINIEDEDTVIILTKPHIGIEKMAAKTLDLVYRKTDNVYVMKDELLLSSSSSREETKQVINILKPKFLFPIIGEYRMQYNLKKIGMSLGINPDNILIPEQGEVFRFYNGELIERKKGYEFNDILIEGKGMNDVSDQVLKDRLLLASSGVIMFICNINARKRILMSKPEIIIKGFYLDEDDKKQIIELFNEIIRTNFSQKFIVWNDIKAQIKEAISKYIFAKTKSNPLVIPVVISVELEGNE